MKKDDILNILEEMWEQSNNTYLGSGEAELDFKENVADWILALLNNKRDERHR